MLEPALALLGLAAPPGWPPRGHRSPTQQLAVLIELQGGRPRKSNWPLERIWLPSNEITLLLLLMVLFTAGTGSWETWLQRCCNFGKELNLSWDTLFLALWNENFVSRRGYNFLAVFDNVGPCCYLRMPSPLGVPQR